MTSHALRLLEPEALHFTEVLEDLRDRLSAPASEPSFPSS